MPDLRKMLWRQMAEVGDKVPLKLLAVDTEPANLQ